MPTKDIWSTVEHKYKETNHIYKPRHSFVTEKISTPGGIPLFIPKLTRVAAHVQAETIPAAIRPGLTLRDALENSSAFSGEKPVYRAWRAVRHIINALKNKPIPEGAWPVSWTYG